MATIYDIAKHVGVSAGTVSRALSRPEKVQPATRTRIEQAAAALGYVPNTVARTLKTQRSSKILVTVPDIANPFFAQILQGAEEGGAGRRLRRAAGRHPAPAGSRGALCADASAE